MRERLARDKRSSFYRKCVNYGVLLPGLYNKICYGCNQFRKLVCLSLSVTIVLVYYLLARLETILIKTLLIMTLLKMTLLKMTLLIMTLLILTLLIKTLLIMTLLIMTLLIMTLLTMTLLKTLINLTFHICFYLLL
jgi:hypothetical protein